MLSMHQKERQIRIIRKIDLRVAHASATPGPETLYITPRIKVSDLFLTEKIDLELVRPLRTPFPDTFSAYWLRYPVGPRSVPPVEVH